MRIHEELDCINRVNAKPVWEVSALNRIQHEERETWGRTWLLLHAPQTSLIPRPSHRPILFTSTFYILEAVKNWTMGRLENDATPNQACSNLVPPPPTKQYHRFTASNRYIILQLHRHEARSASTSHLHTSRACLKLLWSRLQTTYQKWFINRFVNQFLNQFSTFTPGVSKQVQWKPAWELV